MISMILINRDIADIITWKIYYFFIYLLYLYLISSVSNVCFDLYVAVCTFLVNEIAVKNWINKTKINLYYFFQFYMTFCIQNYLF